MPFSLIQTLGSIPIACIDLETTGASAEFGHCAIEVGVVRYEKGVKVGEYSQLIDPQRRIGPGVTALTGISQAMCEGRPTFEQQMPAMMEMLKGAAILGHNIRFDLSFLINEFRRCGREIVELLENAPVLDTVRIARRRFGRGGNGLSTLARRLGYEPAVAHRALADAVTTGVVFDRLLEPVGGWGICLCDAMKEQGGPMGLLPTSARQSLLPLELEEALWHRKPVMMEYLDAKEARTERMIDLIEVRRFKGELVLVAHCHLRNERRNFKLERVVGVRRVEVETARPAAAPVEVVRVEQPVLF